MIDICIKTQSPKDSFKRIRKNKIVRNDVSAGDGDIKPGYYLLQAPNQIRLYKYSMRMVVNAAMERFPLTEDTLWCEFYSMHI